MKKFIIAATLALFIMLPGMALADATANAVQDQSQVQSFNPNQDQNQGQGQDQSSINVNDGNTLIYAPKYAPAKRGFAIPNDIHYPGMPSYFGKAIPSFQFQSVKTLLMYKSVFSVEELRSMAKSKGRVKSTRILPTVVNSSYGEAATFMGDPIPTDEADKYMVIYITKPTIEVDLVGYVTCATRSKVGLSVQTLAAAALAAHEMGANIIHVSAEGAERKLTTNGWGVGFNQTHATINGGGENTGNVSSGGFGVSGGSAGYRDLPWVQVFALHSVK